MSFSLEQLLVDTVKRENKEKRRIWVTRLHRFSLWRSIFLSILLSSRSIRLSFPLSCSKRVQFGFTSRRFSLGFLDHPLASEFIFCAFWLRAEEKEKKTFDSVENAFV